MKKFFAQFKDKKHFVKFCFALPFWLYAHPAHRLPLNEFISGLLPHEHTYSNVPYDTYKNYYLTEFFFKCTHPGCNDCISKAYLTERGIKLNRYIMKRFPERYDGAFKNLYENASTCNPADMELWDNIFTSFN